MPQSLFFTIKNLVPDSRQEETPNGNQKVDSQLIKEWTNQVVELDTDDDLRMEEEDLMCLSNIADYFFDEWTDQTGWLFHELVVELPSNLKTLLSENEGENQRIMEWFYPGMFCPRNQVIQFV